jgi:hypothetical protein
VALSPPEQDEGGRGAVLRNELPAAASLAAALDLAFEGWRWTSATCARLGS